MNIMQKIPLTTNNGRLLSARVFSATEPRSVVVVAGAMGVPQSCYEKFARFLCEQGHSVITFDYFGMGESLQTPLRHCQTNISDWGEEDCTAIIRFARDYFPGLKLQWIGHSVGGQLLGMIPAVNQIDQAITVASGSGYWRENSPPTKRVAWLLWYFIAPLSVPLAGYFPGARLNMVGDLPANVMRQWRRWCLNREYAVGAEGEAMRVRFASVTVPITSVAFSDDEMMSRRNIESLHSFYQNSPRTMIRLKPADIGEKKIGHLGWFRERYRDSVWAGQLLPLLQ